MIEIQLTNLSSTNKAVKPAQREGFVRDFALTSLTELDRSIGLDIRFIQQSQLKDISDSRDERNSTELDEQTKHLTRSSCSFRN
jgi:hypothetical protein